MNECDLANTKNIFKNQQTKQKTFQALLSEDV